MEGKVPWHGRSGRGRKRQRAKKGIVHGGERSCAHERRGHGRKRRHTRRRRVMAISTGRTPSAPSICSSCCDLHTIEGPRRREHLSCSRPFRSGSIHSSCCNFTVPTDLHLQPPLRQPLSSCCDSMSSSYAQCPTSSPLPSHRLLPSPPLLFITIPSSVLHLLSFFCSGV